MATYNRNTGTWNATGPNGQSLGSFATQEQAVKAEQAAGAGAPAATTTPTAQEFGRVTNTAIAQGGGAGGGDMGTNAASLRTMLGADRYAAQTQGDQAARDLRANQARLASTPYGTPTTQGGTATNFNVSRGTGVGGTPQQGVQTRRDTGNRYQLGPDGNPVVDPTTGQPIILGPDGLPLPPGSTINGAPGSGAPGAPGGPGGTSPNDAIDRATSEALGVVEGNNDTQGIQDRIDTILTDAQLTRDAGQQANIDRALDAQSGLIDRVLSQPSDARIVAEQMAAEARGQALSARGGAAAQQQAMNQVAMQNPAMQTAAARSAVEETDARNRTAGTIAAQMGQTAIGSEQNDIRIQEANAGLANSLSQFTSQLGLGELNMNQSDRHLMGSFVRDFQVLLQNTEFNWGQLDVTQRRDVMNYILGRYTADLSAETQRQIAAMANDEDFLDKFSQFMGAVAPFYGGD